MPSPVGETGFAFAAAVRDLLVGAAGVGVSAGALRRDLGLEDLKPSSFDTKMRRAVAALAEQGIETEWSRRDHDGMRILRLVEPAAGPEARELHLSENGTETRRLIAGHLARIAYVDNRSDVLLYIKGGMRRERIRFRYPGLDDPVEGHAYELVPIPGRRGDMLVVITDDGAKGFDPKAIFGLQVVERSELSERPDTSDTKYLQPADLDANTAMSPLEPTPVGRPTRQREQRHAQAAARLMRDHHHAGRVEADLFELAEDIGAATSSPDSLHRIVKAANRLLAADGISVSADHTTVHLATRTSRRRARLNGGDALQARAELRALRELGTQARVDFGLTGLIDEQLDDYQTELDRFLNFVTPRDTELFAAATVLIASADRMAVDVTHDGVRHRLRPDRARLIAGEWHIEGINADGAPVNWPIADLHDAALVDE